MISKGSHNIMLKNEVHILCSLILTILSLGYSWVRNHHGHNTRRLVDSTQVNNTDTPTSDYTNFNWILVPRISGHV